MKPASGTVEILSTSSVKVRPRVSYVLKSMAMPTGTRNIDRIIHAERDNHHAVVLTTHDLDEAHTADHVLLVSGRVVASGTPDEVSDAEESGARIRARLPA